jgi:hypothetical protein
MITTAVDSINVAHRAVFDVARKAVIVLAGYEGTCATLTRSDIAASIGIDVRDIKEADRFLVYLAIDAALEHRGWVDVSPSGNGYGAKVFCKLPATKHYGKPSVSPVARERRKTS